MSMELSERVSLVRSGKVCLHLQGERVLGTKTHTDLAVHSIITVYGKEVFFETR